jgi:DNA-binding transcriptional ArsR family regulator
MQLHEPQLDQVFGALADPTRRAILARLAGGEATVNELAAPFQMSLPSVSKHLKVLEGAGLISRGREAQWRPCRLETAPLRAVDSWLERYRRHWEGSFDKMEELLQELQGAGKGARRPEKAPQGLASEDGAAGKKARAAGPARAPRAPRARPSSHSSRAPRPGKKGGRS